jgi:hypothetical protein
MPRRRPGRPRLAERDTTVSIRLRVPSRDFDALDADAREQRTTMQELIRRALPGATGHARTIARTAELRWAVRGPFRTRFSVPETVPLRGTIDVFFVFVVKANGQPFVKEYADCSSFRTVTFS